jgi:cystathionine beta-synthase
VRQAFTIPDEESLLTARALLHQEGILAGSSSGTLVAAALRYCRQSPEPRRVVTFICDSGNKYLSKMFNDYWMRDQGFLRGAPSGDLRDLIARSHDKGSVVAVTPEDSLLMAHGRMKLYDVSQLPVLENDRIIGILDESDVLLAACNDTAAFKRPVRDFMSSRLTTVTADTALADLLPIFDQGMVAIVVSGEQFLGLVTRIDALNYLRRRLS